MDPRAELSEFLRSRRARLRPEDTGLPVFGGRRRVPGLRREELAQLAGVSVDYYVRLEQGRLGNVSESILNAVAVALRLDDAERTHLYNLARPAQRHRPQQRHSGNREQVRPGQQWLLDALYEVPAYILGRRLDVVAWNDQASALLSVDLDALAPEERNLARLIFLDDTSRDLWGNWTQKARDTLGGLRMHAGLFPDDPLMAQLRRRAVVEEHGVPAVVGGSRRLGEAARHHALPPSDRRRVQPRVRGARGAGRPRTDSGHVHRAAGLRRPHRPAPARHLARRLPRPPPGPTDVRARLTLRRTT